MNYLIVQVVLAVGMLLLFLLRCQSCARQPRHARRVVPVRAERHPPVPPVSRLGVRQHHLLRLSGTRTIALSTLPIPINGTLEVAAPVRQPPPDVAPTPTDLGFASPEVAPAAADLSFAPPDVALMERVLKGLRALPDAPPRSCPGADRPRNP